MWVVEMAVHQVVYVVAVRDRLMAAARPVPVGLIMSAAVVARGAVGGVRRVHRQHVLVHVVAVDIVEVAVVQVVRVPLMLDGGVPAAGAVLVVVVRVRVAAHGYVLSRLPETPVTKSSSCRRVYPHFMSLSMEES
jgi:hypothetical protein